jgi:hypothetical protein
MNKIGIFVSSTLIGLAFLAGSTVVRAQIFYTNSANADFYWTNTTAWSVAGHYPGSQGGTEIAIITNAGQAVTVDANNPLISDLFFNSTDGDTLILTNVNNQTLTITDSFVIGSAANPGTVTVDASHAGGVFAVTNATGTGQLIVGPANGGAGTLIVGANVGSPVTLIADQVYVTNNQSSSFLFSASGTPFQGAVTILHGSVINAPGTLTAQATIGSSATLAFLGGTNVLAGGGGAGSGSLVWNGTLIVSGPNTLLTNALGSRIFCNASTTNGTLIVSGGAKFYQGPGNYPCRIGNGNANQPLSNQLVEVTDPGSTLDLSQLGSGNVNTSPQLGLQFAENSHSSRLIVTNGAYLLVPDMSVGQWGGTFTPNSYNMSYSNNMYVVANGVVTNYGVLRVGFAGSANGTNSIDTHMTINSGGKVYTGFGGGLLGSIGDVTAVNGGWPLYGGALNYGNSVVVSDPGSLWDVAGTIHVGLLAEGQFGGHCLTNDALVVQNSGQVLAQNLYSSSSTGGLSFVGDILSNNQVIVNGGSLYVTSGGTGVLQIGRIGQGSIVISNGGLVQADNLVMTNYIAILTNTPPSSIYFPNGTNYFVNTFNFSDGTLKSGNTTYSNGVAFIVGSGGASTATFTMLGGTHQFFNGLVVTNNGVLAGTGTIVGPTTVLGTLSPGSGASVGTITIDGNVVLGSSAVLQYALGSSSDETIVNGNLTVAGTLDISNSGGFGTGIYPLFTYTGALVNNGLAVGTTPNPAYQYSIDTTSEVGVVNVDVTSQSSNPFATWQSHYFTGSPLNSSPNADPLGKGMSNTNQFLAGFNPTNAAAYLHVINIAKTNNNADIRVTYLGASGDSTYNGGPASRTNVLEFTTGTANGSYTNSFASTGQTNILSGGTGLGAVATMVDSGGATNKPSRYYRVRVLLP